MRPEHEHANRILAHWPDRDAMREEYRKLPKAMRPVVSGLVRVQQRLFEDYRFFAWCTVRPKRGNDEPAHQE